LISLLQPLDLAGMHTAWVTATQTISLHHGVWNESLVPVTVTLAYSSVLDLPWGIYSGTASAPDVPLVPITGPIQLGAYYPEQKRDLWLIATVPAGTRSGAETLVITATDVTSPALTASTTDLVWVGDWVAPSPPPPWYRLYLPLVVRGSSSPSQATAATSAEATTGQPVRTDVQPQAIISPTSSFVLYSRADDTTIWLKDKAGHAKLMDGIRPRLSPDGRYIVYQDEALFGDLHVRDLQTGQVTQVYTTSDYLLVSSWTGDGSRIVFDHGCHIYGMDRDGSNLATLIDTWPGVDYCYNDSPDVNRVDGRLAWENEWYGLGVAEADGSNPTWVPNTQPHDYSPRWSPDGQWLAFWRESDAYKIRPDGTGLTQLTFLPAGNWLEDSGQWTPDGKYLVAAAQVNGIEGLYAVSTEGSSCLLPLVRREWEDPDWVGSVGNVRHCCTFLPLVLRSSPSP
jgi:hypothetical protein